MKKETTLKQRLPAIREIVAIVTWAYTLVKLFIFDLDSYLVAHVAPDWLWLLNLRLFAIASVLAILWISLGHKRFAAFVAYLICYPFIVLFWKLPKHMWRRWAVVVILAPTIYTTAVSLRSTFVLYTAAAVSTIVIALARKPAYVVPAMLLLGGFLVIHLFRAFRRAHSSSLFSQLAKLTRGFRAKIDNGSFDLPTAFSTTPSKPQVVEPQQGADTPVVPQLYILHVFADFIADKVETVTRDRKYNALLAISILNAFVMSSAVFALENWALYRMDAPSFRGVEGDGFLQFLAYSLGHLATTTLTTIQPLSGAATALATAEVFCSILILVIGAFSILTAARDTYREDLGDLTDAIHEVAAAIDHRIVVTYSQTREELEMALAIHRPADVNFLRRIRGLGELPTRVDEPNVPDDDVSADN